MLRNAGSIGNLVAPRRAFTCRNAVSHAALAVATLAAASAADAQAVPNLVSACAGVSLPPSVVTGIMAPVINGVAAPLQGRVNALGSGLGGLPLIPALSIDTTGLLQNAASGQPVTLQVLNANGQVVGPNDRCDLQATSYGLDTQGGIAIGGNSITGLGSDGLRASAGEANSIAFGNSATTDATALRSIALGTGAHTGLGAVGSVALGAGAAAVGANSVALGANSVAARGATTGYAALGLALPQASTGEVSVGATGAARQITNVAAGVAPTDAVNVGQLTGVDARVTTATTAVTNLSLNVNNGAVGPVRYSSPLTPTVPNGGTPTNDVTLAGVAPTPVGLHNVRAGAVNAVSTDAVNGAQLYALGYDVDALSGLAVQYDDATHARVTLGGIGGTSVALGNVRAGLIGAGSTDAVNGSQLGRLGNQAAAALGGGSHYDPVTNSLATELTYNGQAYTSVQAAFDAVDSGSADSRYFHANSTGVAAIASGAESVAIGPVAVASAANSVALGAGSIAARGATLAYAAPGLALPQASAGEVSVGAVGAERQITNVAAGVAATDAANVGQVEGIATQLAALGDDAVQYDGSDKTRITLGGIGGTTVANVKAGAVTAVSSDAVNGSQLFAANQTIANLNTSVINNSTITTNLTTQISNGGIGPVQYSNAGTPRTPNGGVRSQDLTLVGALPGAVGLHNVGAGVIGAGSTDAVNGGQFAGLGNAVAGVFGGNYAYNSGTNGFVGSFSYNGGSYTNVQSVFSAIESDISTGDPVSGGSNKYFHTNSTMADSQADGMNSTAVGGDAVSSGESSIAVGNTALASGDQSVAIGVNATAMDGKAVSIGMGNTASGDGAVAIGDPNFATGDGSAALGKDNTATGIGAVALGNTNIALNDGAIALGNQNSATGKGAVSIGSSNVSNGLGAVAIGSNNNAQGDNSLAIGSGVQTLATDTLAIGNLAGATGNGSVTIGNRSNGNGENSVAVGNDANATMLGASALGQTANATGVVSLALGAGTAASGQASTALGALSTASARGATALGTGAIADRIDSVALGGGAQTTRGPVAGYSAFGLADSQSSQGEIAVARNVVFIDPTTGLAFPTGGRQITGVAAGSAGTDAVNVSQLQGVSMNLGTAIAGGLGGGASYDPTTGRLVGPSYSFGGFTYSNVGDALQALAANGTGPGTGVANPVTYTDNSHGSIDLAAGGTQIRDVAAGAVNANSTDAVNGSQLAAVSQQIESTQAAVSSLTTEITNGAIGTVQYSNAATPTTPNGGIATNDLTLVGAAPVQAVGLHNVAAGTVAAGSTDAINGSQLAATNHAVVTAQTTADSALTLGRNSVQYDAGGRTDVTLGDADTPVALHNLGAGTAATDAVNVAQLGQGIGSAVTQANSYTDSRIAALHYDLRAVRKDASAGTAGALAAAGLPQPYEAGKGMVAMALGAYGSQTAFAVGLSKAMNDGHTVVKLGGTYDTQQRAGASAGVGYQF